MLLPLRSLLASEAVSSIFCEKDSEVISDFHSPAALHIHMYIRIHLWAGYIKHSERETETEGERKGRRDREKDKRLATVDE